MTMLLGLLLHLGTAAAAQAVDTPATVVVHGYSARDVKARVKACEARGCNGFEYANDVLAAANTAFVAGDYDTARALLNAAVRRFDATKAPTRARVAIFEAQSVVAEHEGDRRDAAGAYERTVYALHTQPDGDKGSEVLARLALGDLLVRMGKVLDARRAYGKAAAVADETGSLDLRAAVDIHAAVLDYRDGAGRRAADRLRAIVDSAQPIGSSARLAAAIILARMAREAGDMKPTEALLALTARQPADGTPTLVFSPPIEAPVNQPIAALGMPAGGGSLAPQVDIRSTDRDLIEWADVGYWIRPNGRVEDVEVLRGSAGRSWLRPVESAVAHRVYMARTAGPATDPGYYMVERFTLGYPMVLATDTLIRKRAGSPTITELVLARQDIPPPPPTPHGSR